MLRLKNDKGRLIDQSGPRPFQFKLGAGEVIKAWDLACAEMSQGETAKFTFDSSLCYGRQSIGNGLIPANSDLIFQITLHSW